MTEASDAVADAVAATTCPVCHAEDAMVDGVCAYRDVSTWHVEEQRSSRALSGLLSDEERFITRFVVMSPAASATLAVWVAHAHAFRAAETTLYVEVTSAASQSGKTRLFEVLEGIVRDPFMITDPSTAAIFRTIHKDESTLLLDEIDTIFGGDKKERAALVGILNAGYRRGATVPRVVGEGKSMRVEKFNVFSPKAFAGIGRRLPPQTASRCVLIKLKRKKAGEEAERFRVRRTRGEAERLRTQLAEWAALAVDQLADAEPEMPEELTDRQMDAWEPLFAIADMAGGEWPSRIRQAAVELHGEQDDEATSIQLLADIKAILEPVERIHSADLVRELNEIEESSWGGWNDGGGITAREVARHLNAYEVSPKQVWINNVNRRGYEVEQFADTWERYLQTLPSPSTAHVSARALDPRSEALSENGAEKCSVPKTAPDQHPSGLADREAPEGLEGPGSFPEVDGSLAEDLVVEEFDAEVVEEASPGSNLDTHAGQPQPVQDVHHGDDLGKQAPQGPMLDTSPGVGEGNGQAPLEVLPEDPVELARIRYEAGQTNLFILARELRELGHKRPDGGRWLAADLALALGLEL